MRRAEATAFGPLTREFNRVAKEARDNYAAYGSIDYANILPEHRNNLLTILRKLYAVSADSGVEQITDMAEGKANIEYVERKVDEWAFGGFLLDWLNERSQKRAEQITETTENILQRSADKATAANLGLEESAKLIQQSVGGSVSVSRAQTIARTESHSALQGAKQSVVDDTGLAGNKEWMTTEDGRERHWHAEVDGQVVRVNEMFRVPNSKGTAIDLLEYPGDPSAPAEQVINCRCQWSFIPDSEQDLDRVNV